ncbi:MAG: hypothetical protein Q9226_005348 [Calogaya cf. arnoldii]
MDQSAVNGAQAFYFPHIGIGDDQVWLQGLNNGAPYLCSAVVGCWSNKPLNYISGAADGRWWNLRLARFMLGLAVGAKTSITPVYAAEWFAIPRNCFSFIAN